MFWGFHLPGKHSNTPTKELSQVKLLNIIIALSPATCNFIKLRAAIYNNRNNYSWILNRLELENDSYSYINSWEKLSWNYIKNNTAPSRNKSHYFSFPAYFSFTQYCFLGQEKHRIYLLDLDIWMRQSGNWTYAKPWKSRQKE